jgi:hypothetical protein
MKTFYCWDEGNAERVKIEAKNAKKAAEEYVEDGDWGNHEFDPVNKTWRNISVLVQMENGRGQHLSPIAIIIKPDILCYQVEISHPGAEALPEGIQVVLEHSEVSENKDTDQTGNENIQIWKFLRSDQGRVESFLDHWDECLSYVTLGPPELM